MIAIKISLGLFFLRIFIERWMRRTTIAIVAVSVMFSVAYLFQVIFQCGAPIKGPEFWEKTLAHQCLYKSLILGFVYTHAILMAVTDATFVILPIIFVSGTTKPLREKVMIAGILVVGAV